MIEANNSPTPHDQTGNSLHYFLAEASARIRLTKSHREKAEGHYGAIAEVLKNSPVGTLLNKLDVQMTPFGGLGTRTASKPYMNDEFDLDLVVRFSASQRHFQTPDKLFNEVYGRLNSLPKYKERLEKKDRCIRVNYSGEFHLDLMPAIPSDDSTGGTKLWIPERGKNGAFTFRNVDPIGLTRWFDDRCEIEISKSIKFNERGDFEAMPILTEGARKSPLRQSVQLIKRMRDKFFENEKDSKKILKSVVILTVAGETFAGERNLYALVGRILAAIDSATSDLSTSKVLNPVHPEEDFIQPLRVRPDRYRKLRGFLTQARKTWAELGLQQGIPRMAKELEGIFGEDVAGAVVKEYGSKMDELYKTSRLTMGTTGILGAAKPSGAAIPLRQHQFFGDHS